MNKTVNKKISISQSFRDIAGTITSFFTFVLLGIFPLYTHDKYFDILGARYVFFKVIVMMLFIMLVILGIVYLIVNKEVDAKGRTVLVRFLDAFRIENLKKHLLITDIFFLLMVIGCAISTMGSFKVLESFYGNAGRYQGLECWIMYLVLYVCISRTYQFKKWHLDIALIACAFASIWAVTDFFTLDIFGFLVNVSGGQRAMFASSVGNLNTLTNYTGLLAGVSVVMFVRENNLYKSIFYGFTSICCFAGCVFGLSDNAVLSVLIIYMVTPFIAVKTRKEFLKFVISISFIFLNIFFMYLGYHSGHSVSWMGSFFKELTSRPIFVWAFIPIILISIAVGVACYKIKPKTELGQEYTNPFDAPMSTIFHKVWLGLIIAGVALVTFAVIDYNFIHNFDAFWGTLPSSGQLRINDDWGTHRGHNWRIAFTNFAVFNPFHKLFGYGPDTYLVVTERSFYEEMVKKYGEVYDSAHNEYINYLICEGIVGLGSYLGIGISSIVYGLKANKKNIWMGAIAMGIISYMFQAVVNIAIPITTPIFFTLMFMMVADYRNQQLENEETRL